jgi:hypothetical protein
MIFKDLHWMVPLAAQYFHPNVHIPSKLHTKLHGRAFNITFKKAGLVIVAF